MESCSLPNASDFINIKQPQVCNGREPTCDVFFFFYLQNTAYMHQYLMQKHTQKKHKLLKEERKVLTRNPNRNQQYHYQYQQKY